MTFTPPMSATVAAGPADILGRCGITALTSDPPAGAVDAALRLLAAEASGLDDLGRLTIRNEAITALTTVGCRSPARLVDAALSAASKSAGPAVAEVTYGGALVDIVVADSGATQWLVIQDGVPTILDRVGGAAPWDQKSLPWPTVPSSADVMAAIANGCVSPFAKLVELLLQSVILPAPTRAWAYLLAGWVLATYLLDRWAYMPILLLEGPPARGKSRLSRLLAFCAYRGYITPSPTAATLFRDRAWHRVTLGLDVQDVGATLENKDLGDLVLESFSRDSVIRRVTRMDAAPDKQVEAFASYGATILISNIPLRPESPLATRCFRIGMPEAGQTEVPAPVRPENVTAIRAEAVAWASTVLAQPHSIPQVHIPLTSRLRDCSEPIIRVLNAVAPETIAEVMALLQELDEERRQEAISSPEARVAIAVWELRDAVTNGRLYVSDVTRAVNAGLPKNDQLTPQQVGRARRTLGLGGGLGGTNKTAYIEWPGNAEAEAMHRRYAGVRCEATVRPIPPESPVRPVPVVARPVPAHVPGGPGGSGRNEDGLSAKREGGRVLDEVRSWVRSFTKKSVTTS